jgi:hypothetical protein
MAPARADDGVGRLLAGWQVNEVVREGVGARARQDLSGMGVTSDDRFEDDGSRKGPPASGVRRPASTIRRAAGFILKENS